jgi:hypothetical protein
LAKIKRKPWRAAKKKSDKAAEILKFPTGVASKLNKNEKRNTNIPLLVLQLE